jgi:hypothetical protein
VAYYKLTTTTMDANPISTGEVIPMTPSLNGIESDSPINIANLSPYPMAPIRQAINNYEPFTAFGRKALSTLLYAIDEIHSLTPTEDELDYSNLIQMLREDFPCIVVHHNGLNQR